MADASVDSNVQLLIEDLYVLRDAMRGEADDERRRELIQHAAGYLVVNRALLEHAFAAWGATSEEALRALDAEHRQLDNSAATHQFGDIAWQAVKYAPNIIRDGPGGMFNFDDDDLHMLQRLLEYAKLLVDTTGQNLLWHPVQEMLAGNTERLEELRARVLAEPQAEPEREPAVKRAEPASQQDKDLALSDAAARALSFALRLPTAGGRYPPDDPGLLAAAMLVGALRLPPAEYAHTVAADLGRHLAQGQPSADLAARAAAALGIDELPPPVEGVDAAVVRASPFAMLAERAAVHAAPSGATQIHLRHLVAAALTTERPTVLERMLTELGSDPAALRTRLRASIARVPNEPATYWDGALSTSAPVVELAGGISADVVDPTRGIPLSGDHLGVRDYVTMLATVIADGRTPMPLSIGLFGEWGSGKSYFMGLLREQISVLSRSPSGPYLGDVRQIGFNAWHYADTNLWASLGDEIFAQLAGPGEPDDTKRHRLRNDLGEKLEKRRELEAATARAQDETARLSATLDDARARRERSLQGLAGAVAGSEELKKAWNRLGISRPIEQGELLEREIRGAAADADVLRHSLAGGRAGLLAALAALVSLLLVAAVVLPSDAGRWAVAAVVPVLGTAVTVVARVRSGLRVLNDVAVGLRDGADDATQEQLDALRQSEAQERVARAQLDEVVDQVGELGRQLAELDPGQRLYRFLTDRAGGESYRRHLGLISTVRKDFEQLAALMTEWRDAGTSAPEPIDRIVLYIDDLDRCSPEQVVDVLQAVHLLLALELFVVVVGVDPRWLLRSLRREYRSILTSDDGANVDNDEWVTTPQDYLEKIFNIPFTLPGMTSDSFRGLLESMADTSSGPTNAEHATRRTLPDDPEPRSTEGDSGAALPVADVPVEANSEVASVQAGAPASEVHPLSKPELDLLAALAPLVATPREAKRLLNLYRMIRSTRNLSPASRFLGDWSYAGDYQAVIVLLGLLSSHGRLLEAVLVAEPHAPSRAQGGLLHRSPETTWATFAEGLAPQQSDAGWKNDVVGDIPQTDLSNWQHLAAGLVDATALLTLDDVTTFQLWAPRVARFSFLSTTFPPDGASTTADGDEGSPRRGPVLPRLQPGDGDRQRDI